MLDLIGDDARPDACGPESLEHDGDALEGTGAVRHVGGVVVEEFGPEGEEGGIVPADAHGLAEKAGGAPARVGTELLFGKRGDAPGGPHHVDGERKVGCGVDEGAVKVEEKKPDGHGRAVLRGGIKKALERLAFEGLPRALERALTELQSGITDAYRRLQPRRGGSERGTERVRGSS